MGLLSMLPGVDNGVDSRTRDEELSASTSKEDGPLTLDALDADALRELFGHLKVPLALKLVCRALRAAAPARTVSYVEHAHETLAQLQWACGTGLKVYHELVEGVAARGQLDQLLWMEQSSSDLFVNHEVHVAAFQYKKGFHVYHEAANTAAASHGHVHILERFAPVGRSFLWWEPIYRAAGFGGQLETLKWLCARYGECELDSNVLAAAAVGGHLETIKWMHVEKGVSWNESAIKSAAKGGHVHVLAWLHSCAQPLRDDNPWEAHDPLYWAVYYGHLNVLKWAREHLVHAQAVADRQEWPCVAASQGQVGVLRWMRGIGAEFGDFTRVMRAAIDRDRLDVLKWAHAEGMVAELRQAYQGPRPVFGADSDEEDPVAEWLAKMFPDLA